MKRRKEEDETAITLKLDMETTEAHGKLRSLENHLELVVKKIELVTKRLDEVAQRVKKVVA